MIIRAHHKAMNRHSKHVEHEVEAYSTIVTKDGIRPQGLYLQLHFEGGATQMIHFPPEAVKQLARDAYAAYVGLYEE